MPKHEVKFMVPERPVEHADIVFRVYSDEEKFAEMRISKGGVDWYPANKKVPYSLTWEKLDELIRGAS